MGYLLMGTGGGIAAGIAVLAMSLTSMEALTDTALAYYERYRFADVFARVERAPIHIAGRIRQLPGRPAHIGRVAVMAAVAVLLQVTLMPYIAVSDGAPDSTGRKR
jgi:putative ABC transport system permease protein